ncbi:DAK2 domain-containing protein [Nocardioides salsibiostraticola]
MEQTPQGGPIQLAIVLRFVDIATDALALAREEIDALNVYPVPDGDTGTNMYLTVSAARDAIREAAADKPEPTGREDLIEALAVFRRGALLGARGNSGVILSEMLGAIARRISEATPEEPNVRVMADALRMATEASYAAVGEPVEGTILSVARAASEAALLRAADPAGRTRDVFTDAAQAAREALARTPEQLPVLRDAGVVDAGGRGLSVIFDAAETALTGRRPIPVTVPLGQHTIPIPRRPEDRSGSPDSTSPVAGEDRTEGLSAEGPAYEVMYLLDTERTGDDVVPHLRTVLGSLGDSLVVVGGEGLWNVHVHVDDVGAAIEAGIEAGRPHRVRVTHFAEQVEAAKQSRRRTGRGIVVVAAGPGLEALFTEAGAVVVAGGPQRRPSTGQILEAILGCGAEEIIVLPNDADSVRVAQIAASTAATDYGLRVNVIPTQAQVQGLAAVAVHEPGRSFDQDIVEMTATARHVRHGAVTIAARQAMTMAGPCEIGDVLGVISGDFAVVGKDLDDVAQEVLRRLLASGGELVTLVAGAEDQGLTERLTAWVEQEHPTVDAVVYDGGQERYPLLLSVE